MNKMILTGVLILILGAGAYFLLGNKAGGPLGGTPDKGKTENQKPKYDLNPLNASYIVEGQVVTLKNGKEEKAITDGGEKLVTEVWDKPISGDLNSDGQPDYAMVITQKTTGDVGVYYYAAVALADQNSGIIAGSNAVALGDRVEMKDISIINAALKVNFADRKYSGDEAEPSSMVATTKTFALDGAMLKELFPKQAKARAEAVCTDSGAKWNKETSECQGLSKDMCDKYKGQFVECKTKDCSPICQF